MLDSVREDDRRGYCFCGDAEDEVLKIPIPERMGRCNCIFWEDAETFKQIDNFNNATEIVGRISTGHQAVNKVRVVLDREGKVLCVCSDIMAQRDNGKAQLLHDGKSIVFDNVYHDKKELFYAPKVRKVRKKRDNDKNDLNIVNLGFSRKEEVIEIPFKKENNTLVTKIEEQPLEQYPSPVVQELTIQEPVVQELTIQEPIAQEPIVQEPIAEPMPKEEPDVQSEDIDDLENMEKIIESSLRLIAELDDISKAEQAVFELNDEMEPMKLEFNEEETGSEQQRLIDKLESATLEFDEELKEKEEELELTMK
jgi:hypothetical protein